MKLKMKLFNNSTKRVWFVTALLAVISSTTSFAQTNERKEIEESAKAERNEKLGEVVVSSLRINRKLMETPAPMAIATSYDYKKFSYRTASDALNLEPGISAGGDGVWARNINVRGLGESRLVTLVDGNRVETATDLTASLSMVDVNDIDHIEVIKGAQSVLYGSGAMGGIVNIITKEGHFSQNPYFSGNLISGYSSVNKYFSNYLTLNSGAKRWYLKLAGTFGRADDIKTPEGTLKNSQFTTSNFSARLGVKPFANHLLKVQYQRNYSYDVGIPGGSAFPGPATATYKNIGRTLLDASYEISKLTEKFAALKISYFHQYIVKDVEMRPNTVTNTTLANGNIQQTIPELVTPNAQHNINGAQIQTNWIFSDNNSLIAGADIWGRRVTSDRTKYVTVNVINPDGKILKTNNIERGETPIPTASSTSTGFYVNDDLHLLNNKMTISIGGRVDKIWVKNEECYDVDYIIMNGVRNDKPANQRVTFEKNNLNDLSWSANIGVLYKLTGNVDAELNIARSYRAPSIEERYKYIDLGNYVRLGNPDLKAENGYSGDMGIRIWGKRLTIQASIFANRITNMVGEDKGEYIYRVTETNKQETLPALIYANISKALLYGFDFKVDYHVIDNLSLSFASSYVIGRDTKKRENLPMIPPFKAIVGASYSCPNIGSLSMSLYTAAKQAKVAEGEIKTGGYCKLDLSIATANMRFGKCGVQLFTGIDNITNRSYSNHISTNRGSISVEPGRNFYVRASFTF